MGTPCLLLTSFFLATSIAVAAQAQEFGPVRSYSGDGLFYSKLVGDPITRESFLVSQREHSSEDSFGSDGTIRYVFKYSDGTSTSQLLNFWVRCGGPGGDDLYVEVWGDNREATEERTIIEEATTGPAGIERDAYDLFRAVCHPQRFESPASGLSAPSVDKFIEFQNRDSGGALLRTLQGVDLQSCASACGNESQCQAYAYDKWNRWCSLKHMAGELLISPKAITGVRADVSPPQQSALPIEMRRYRGKTFPKGGVMTRKTRSFEACERSCRDATSCVAFTYVRTSRRCRLMESTGEYFSDRTADSGAKFQAGR